MFLEEAGSVGNASTRVISTSNRRNNSAIRKNWKENGIWEGAIMLNPHSNCVHLSLYDFSFFLTVFVASARIIRIAIEIRIVTVIFIFHFSS